MKTLKRLFTVLLFIQALFITNSKAQFSFVHISDIHVSDFVSYTNSPDIGGLIFEQVIENLNNLIPKPAFVVASGDISNIGSYLSGMYSVLTQYLFFDQLSSPGYGDYFIDSARTIPIYFVPGNHDYFNQPISPISDPALENYSSYLSPTTDFSITYQNAVILFVLSGYDQYRSVWIDTNPLEPEGSGLSISQCNFIRTTLNADNDKKKIIVMHHPPVNAHGTNADGNPYTGTILDVADGSIINNREVLLDICDSTKVDMVLAGHVHQNLVADRFGNIVNETFNEGTRYIQTAASLNGAYRIITVDSSFVWAGDPQNIYFTGIPGYNAENENNTFEIYSNPSAQILTINFLNVEKTSDADIFLLNMTGQEVFQQNQSIYSGKQIIINTGNYPKGIYLFTMLKGNKTFTKKVVLY